jgi:hypothetical protein
MGPFPRSDRHDEPRAFNQFVPAETAMIENVFIVGEDPVGEPILAHVLPDVLDRIELGGFGRQGNERDVFRHVQLRGDMPPGLIHEQNGVSAGVDGKRDLLEVQRHGLCVAGRHDEAGRLAERGTDSAEDIGRGGSLILQGKWSRAAFRPASRDLVLLTDPGFVLEPDFEQLAAGFGDRRQEVRDFFLKAATAASSCSWWRGRAESFR